MSTKGKHLDQPRRALAAANTIRRTQAGRLAAFRKGKLSAEEVLDDPEMATVIVERFCSWAPSRRGGLMKKKPDRRRKAKAARNLWRKQVFTHTQLGELTAHQRSLVLEVVEAMRNGAG